MRREQFGGRTLDKGNYAEQIVREWLFSRGHSPTKPGHNGSHPIDIFCVRKDGKVYAVDVKAKARRHSFADTGIDYAHYNKYSDIEKGANIDVWVFFVDQRERHVYAATLKELREPSLNPKGCKPGEYPRKEGGIMYFPLEKMHRMFQLTDEQCAELERLSKPGEDPATDQRALFDSAWQ